MNPHEPSEEKISHPGQEKMPANAVQLPGPGRGDRLRQHPADIAVISLRALGRAVAWPVRRVRRARLRVKLALTLSVAALVPMLLVAVLASGVVFGNLEGSHYSGQTLDDSANGTVARFHALDRWK